MPKGNSESYVPAEKAAQLVVQLAAGRADALLGRRGCHDGKQLGQSSGGAACALILGRRHGRVNTELHRGIHATPEVLGAREGTQKGHSRTEARISPSWPSVYLRRCEMRPTHRKSRIRKDKRPSAPECRRPQFAVCSETSERIRLRPHGSNFGGAGDSGVERHRSTLRR